MEREAILTKKLYQALNIMICESKEARSYGTAHRLTYSEIGLLKCVQNYEAAKAGDLSQYLGITNGAVAQLAKRLMEKDYLEPYRLGGNKKEVYYRLTAAGLAACQGYDGHNGRLKDRIAEYAAGLSDEELAKLCGFFDVIIHTAGCERCTDDGPDDGTKTTVKRCEKCQSIY